MALGSSVCVCPPALAAKFNSFVLGLFVCRTHLPKHPQTTPTLEHDQELGLSLSWVQTLSSEMVLSFGLENVITLLPDFRFLGGSGSALQ